MKRIIACCLALLCTSLAGAQTYDTNSRVLTLPSVVVTGTEFTNAQLRLDAVDVVAVAGAAITPGSTSYDPDSRLLYLPSVSIAGSTFTNVQLRLNAVDLVSVGSSAPATPGTRIYVNLVSHNEDTQTGSNADCQAFFTDADNLYDSNRQALESIASTVASKGATYNFQSDVEYLNLVLAKQGSTSNVLRSLSASYPANVDIDAHAHESTTKNYADVANLLERVSGARNGIVGGFTAVACRANSAAPDWEKFRLPLSPKSGSSLSGSGSNFNATALTLGASAGHTCDPSVSGIWRPASASNFYSDDPTQTLPVIGTGYAVSGLTESVAAISRLLDDLKAGRLENNTMYTASVTISHCNMHLSNRGSSPAEVAAYIDAINALDDSNDYIRWATFSQMINLWKSSYGQRPSLWRGQP